MPIQNDTPVILIDKNVDDIEEVVDDDILNDSSDHSFNLNVNGGDESSDHQHHQQSEASDTETEEFSKLRCSSVQTEEISERRRRNPSAGYPGLAFNSSIFSSGTIMKFRVISNELHNIQNVQLRRAEGEVAALQRRIQSLEKELEKSEQSLKIATQELDDVSQEYNKDEGTSEVIEQELIEKYLSLIPDIQPIQPITDTRIKTA